MSGPQVLAAGLVLAQRYEIVSLVGRGGMGAVYRARDLRLPTAAWAVKEMWADEMGAEERAEAQTLFEREAHLLASLAHPALPHVSDYFTENGRQYLVMEFIEGETLEARVMRQGPVEVPQAVRWGLQLADALAYLHERPDPIIFRDMKPPNVMVTPTGAVKIIDFGIARIYAAGKSQDTVAFGTPGFAAPEQYGRTQSDARVDVYGLGATLHHLVTGRDPSDQVFRFERPSTLNPAVPAALDEVIMRAVSVEADKRFPRMREMQAALEALYPALGSTATLVPALAGAPTVVPRPAGRGTRELPTVPAVPPTVVTATGPAAALPSVAAASPSVAPAPAAAASGAAPPAPVATPSTAAPAPPPRAAVPSFDAPGIDFGHVRRGETRRVNVRIRGEVDGLLVSSARKWLRAEPHRVKGRDPVTQLVLYTGTLREGREHQALVTLRTKAGEVGLPVSVDIEPARLSIVGVLLAALLTAASLVPVLGVVAAVLLAFLYFSCPLDERPSLRPFAVATTFFTACNIVFVSAALFALKSMPSWAQWLQKWWH